MILPLLLVLPAWCVSYRVLIAGWRVAGHEQPAGHCRGAPGAHQRRLGLCRWEIGGLRSLGSEIHRFPGQQSEIILYQISVLTTRAQILLGHRYSHIICLALVGNLLNLIRIVALTALLQDRSADDVTGMSRLEGNTLLVIQSKGSSEIELLAALEETRIAVQNAVKSAESPNVAVVIYSISEVSR
jgi:hypothetical protein